MRHLPRHAHEHRATAVRPHAGRDVLAVLPGAPRSRRVQERPAAGEGHPTSHEGCHRWIAAGSLAHTQLRVAQCPTCREPVEDVVWLDG